MTDFTSQLENRDALMSCDFTALQARARLYATIRQFFAERQVMEVETPLLSQAASTDVHLASIAAQRHLSGQLHTHYLHTSPEFAMKRLLASGSGPIYQICKVFRDDEHGRKHNSEFSMLEWYRPGFDLQHLMHETADLLARCLHERFDQLRPVVYSYKHAFIDRLDIDPLQADAHQLRTCAERVGLRVDLGEDRLGYMDLLFSHMIEPTLGFDAPVFLTDFPPELAALAKVRTDEDGAQVAVRFEVYIEGLELANGYDELIDAAALRQRFEQDNQQRQARGLPVMPVDQRLLAALPCVPTCAGIALGLDRLLMIALNRLRLDQVLAFPAERA